MDDHRSADPRTLDLDDPGADERALFRLIEGPGVTPGASVVATVHAGLHARGPWDHAALHGGPVAGLAAWAAEPLGAADGLRAARLTLSLLAMVPCDELEVRAEVVKPGRRARLVDVEIHHRDRPVARASTQWLLPSPGWTTDHDRDRRPPGRPGLTARPDEGELGYPRPGFNCDAAELRYARGSNEASGPGVTWARLTSPLMAGQPTSPFVRAATTSDLAVAAGWETGPDGTGSINPDLTLQLAHPPRGPWLAVDAASHRTAHGLGFVEAVMSDDGGPIGRVLASLVASPMQLPGEGGP